MDTVTLHSLPGTVAWLGATGAKSATVAYMDDRMKKLRIALVLLACLPAFISGAEVAPANSALQSL